MDGTKDVFSVFGWNVYGQDLTKIYLMGYNIFYEGMTYVDRPINFIVYITSTSDQLLLGWGHICFAVGSQVIF